MFLMSLPQDKCTSNSRQSYLELSTQIKSFWIMHVLHMVGDERHTETNIVLSKVVQIRSLARSMGWYGMIWYDMIPMCLEWTQLSCSASLVSTSCVDNEDYWFKSERKVGSYLIRVQYVARTFHWKVIISTNINNFSMQCSMLILVRRSTNIA